MAELGDATCVPTKRKGCHWESKDQRFIILMISTQGLRQSQTAQRTHKSMFSVKSDAGHLKEENVATGSRMFVVTTHH